MAKSTFASQTFAAKTFASKTWEGGPPVVVVVVPPPAPTPAPPPAPAVIVDEDTLEAVRLRWAADATTLPTLFADGPFAGRLKSPRTMPYAVVTSEPLRRTLAGTTGGWFDVRKVTITIRGIKADVTQAAGAVLAVFNRSTQLTYPSGARFFKWWPSEEVKLEEDSDTKSGQDIWKATLTAEVTSIRTL